MNGGAVRWKMLLILVVAGTLYLLGNGRVGLWDRDEPRYAQTSKQMVQSDNWVVPHLLDKPRTAKPIFIYWCQAACMKLLGTTPFAARLPSVIGILLTAGVLAWAVGRFIGPVRALWTVFIFATSGLVIASAKMCITDGVLLLWVTIAQLCLFAIYRSARGEATKRPSNKATEGGRIGMSALPAPAPAPMWVAILMWVCVGMAGLTKGPMVLLVQGMTVLALAAIDVGKRWREARAWGRALAWLRGTRPVVGVAVVAAVVAPWLLAIHFREPGFLRTAFWHDVFDRTVKPLEGHKGPPGFYLLTIWGTYAPWCLLLPTALTVAWRKRRLAAIRFSLAAAIGPWIALEFVQTKLPHYLLPAFPPLAFLTADALLRCIRGQFDDLRRPAFLTFVGIWAVIVAIVGAVPWLATISFGPLTHQMLATMAGLSVLAVVAAVVVFGLFRVGRIAHAALAMGISSVALIAFLYGVFLPQATFLWLPQRTADVLTREGATHPGDVVMIDFQEDSLPYYQGGTIRQAEDNYLTATPPADWTPWVVLTREIWDSLPKHIQERLQIVQSLRGLAYADKMRVVEVIVVRTPRP